MADQDMQSLMREWADEFQSAEEFINEVPPTLQGVLDILVEVAEDKGYLTADLFRQFVMFFQYTSVLFSSEVLRLSKEEYVRLAEVSYDAFVNLTATHETSDRRDH